MAAAKTPTKGVTVTDPSAPPADEAPVVTEAPDAEALDADKADTADTADEAPAEPGVYVGARHPLLVQQDNAGK